MNYLALRDSLFSGLHAVALKPSGYKKKGHWVIRDLGSLVHCFYLRASRFGNQSEAIFWIDVQIFSAEWHHLVFPERQYKVPSEGPCLVSRELGRWCSPPMGTIRISAETNLETLKTQLAVAAHQQALPYLAKRESPEELLRRLIDEPELETDYLSIVGLSRMLGHEEQALKYMERAKKSAAHENELRFLELRERSIWRNAA